MKTLRVRQTGEKKVTLMSIGQLAVDNADEELKDHTLDSAFSILGEQGWELNTSTMPHTAASVEATPWFVFKRPLG